MIALIVIVVFFIWVEANAAYGRYLVGQSKKDISGELLARTSALTSTLNHRIALLEGLYAFTRTEWPDSSFDESFEVYSSGIFFNTTGVCTLIIAPEGITRYVYPLADGVNMIGYDLTNDENINLREAVHSTIRTQNTVLTNPDSLHGGCYGVTAIKSVYRGSELWGLVAISLDLSVLLRDSGLAASIGAYDFSLRDRDGKTFYGEESVWDSSPAINSIIVPGGYWEIGVVPVGGWEATTESRAALFRVISLLIVILVLALFYLVYNRQEQLRQAVEARTSQIAQNEKHLSSMVNARTKELSSLLNVSRHLGGIQNIDSLLKKVIEDIRLGLDYSVAAIYHLNGDEGEWVLLKCNGELPLENEACGINVLDSKLVEKVYDTQQPLIQTNWVLAEEFPVKFCWFGAPMIINHAVTGILVLIHKEPQYYKDSDKGLITAYAQQVATALENAELYRQAGQLAIMEERQRLARELHDSVSQVLYSIGLGVKSARTALEVNPAQLPSTIDYIDNLAEVGQTEMRALIFELRPEALVQEGLTSALQKQIAMLTQRHGITVEYDLGEEPEISFPVKEAFYRVAQEALYNIIKHAKAKKVWLELKHEGSDLLMRIQDDGVGFDPGMDRDNHLGLQIMRERALHCNGDLEIRSYPGEGTQIEMRVPLTSNGQNHA